MSFVHLNNHTEYSLLNGAIRIPLLVARAKEFGMPAVAITDYGNLFGAVDFFLEAKKAGIKPIIGCTVFLPSHDQHDLKVHRRGMDHLFQLVLLIKNQTGYKNLCKLMTKSYLDGFYYKPRVDTRLLSEFSEGLLALSGGWNGPMNYYLFEGQREKACLFLEKLRTIFPDRFYLELQENGVEGQKAINDQLVLLAKEKGLPVVATNNCHYLNRDDAEAFEALICIQTGATLHGAHDHLKFSTDGYYFKSTGEMAKDFADYPEALTETLRLAENIDFSFDLNKYYFPRFEPPAGKTLDEYLYEEAMKGLDHRLPEILRHRTKNEKNGSAAQLEFQEADVRCHYETRLKQELEMIQKMGFSGYFLIVSDFILHAKTAGIPVGPGRGSAAGSLVAYCIQITDLDPLPYHLLFERFLNPERISMPDVDIDFCMRGRDKVLDYVSQKYGNVSQIITFGKMKAKAVIRDVGRVMEMPYEEVDKIAKLVPNTLNITLDCALSQEPRLRALVETNPQVSRLMHVAKKLEGLNRHASTHAAGVVISDQPLTDFLPLYKGSNGDVVTQLDMKAVEKIGLIKFDFLGLKTLTVIQDTQKIIHRTRGVTFNILDIPFDDADVYALLSQGDTAGVFQLESSGMKDLLTRMRPSCFEDLIALVALYRPGPLGSGMVDDFINRKQGKTPIVYDLPQLKPVLGDTYGVIVYQEQVMQIASLLAGYSLGEADILRRAMGKKKPEEMAAQKVRFLAGCGKNKFPKLKAEKIFDLMAKFAEYGFNKSHSAAYALVAYQTAYLKAHYRVEYLAAILTTEMHDTDRILYYIQDCQAHGIKVLPPDINQSYWGFSVLGEKQIRYGLGAIKNVGCGAILALVETRNQKGAFKSFFDYCERVDHHRTNKRVIESLIKSGTFDSVDLKRSMLLANMELAIDDAVRRQKEEGMGQSNLFGLIEETQNSPPGLALKEGEPWPETEKLFYEKEALGFYFSGHPLTTYQAELRRVATTDTKLCQNLPSQTEVFLAGMIGSHKVISTKKGDRMAFATFEDLAGSLEVIVFSDLYQKKNECLIQEKPLVLKGVVDRTDEGVKIIAKDMVPLKDYLSEKTRSLHFRIAAPWITEEKMKMLHHLLKEFEGPCRSYLHIILPEETETILELPKGVCLAEQEKFVHRVNSLFENQVVDYRM